MSQFNEPGFARQTVSTTGEKSWERPATADDIVDPIDIGPGTDAGSRTSVDLDREQTEEEAEDVPLDVKLTDALSMLADGGHDYGSRPIVEEEFVEGDPSTPTVFEDVEIDESSKDA